MDSNEQPSVKEGIKQLHQPTLGTATKSDN
jgi:hypothetical protein